MTKIIAEVKVEQPIKAVINRHIIVGRVSHTGGNSVQKLSELENDTGYITEEAIPKDLSDFNNDTNFITLEDVPAIPSKVSQLENDEHFITTADIPPIPDIPDKVSQLENDSHFITASDIPPIPTKTSDLTNNSGFITNSDLPTKTSDLTNNSGFITEEDIPPIPTKTSDLTNDSDFITSEDIPDTQIQSDWNQADTEKKDFIKNKPTQLSQFINNLPKSAKFDILESDNPKKVTLSETPIQDDFTGYNLFIINTGDNSVFLPQGTNYMFPNINGLDIDVDGKEVTINSAREFDGAVFAFYLIDGATNEDIFQFKFMLMGMISSSLLSGHFGMKLSSLKTTAKNYIEAINELKKGLDETSTTITELTYDYALTEKYRYTFTRDVDGVIINIEKELL